MTKRQENLRDARLMVPYDVTRESDRRTGIVHMHERGSHDDAYRREIARLWRVALKAVKEAAK